MSITEAKAVLQQTDRIIRTFPEVEYVFGKAGRADTATDPAPLSMLETTIRLKDRKYWRPGYTIHHIIRDLDAAIKFPGLVNSCVFPIHTRIDMLSTGIKTPVGIKFLGTDLKILNRLAQDSEAILKDVPGTASVYSERVLGGYYFDFVIDREEAGRYGLTVGDVEDVIQSALGGMNISQTVEGLERYPVNLRYFQDYRENNPSLRRVLIPTPSGAQIPIDQVARIKVHQGPPRLRVSRPVLLPGSTWTSGMLIWELTSSAPRRPLKPT
jgi:Cu(I)/Ag(I) efflux system membrane protein CusA/SilA